MGPVDLYVAVYVPAIDSDDYYLLRPDNTLQKLSDGIVKWKEGFTGVLDDHVLGDIPVSSLFAGRYEVSLLATPAGSQGSYYCWTGVFEVR